MLGKNFAEALADVAKGNETVEWAPSLPQLAAGTISFFFSFHFHFNFIFFTSHPDTTTIRLISIQLNTILGRTLMVSGGITCQETRVALGVVAAIVPFNFPAMVSAALPLFRPLCTSIYTNFILL